jgi:hypothetical protein
MFISFNITIVSYEINCQNESENIQSSNSVEYYALIIGVELFDENSTLDYPEEAIDDGAVSFYENITKKNFKEENVKLILNEQAKKNDIKNAITQWLDEREDENDIVLYYFSGHSWKMPINKRNLGHTYSFPYESYAAKYSDEKITDVELDSWLDELESKNIVCVMDTCYSGRMKSLVQNGRILLAAGGKYILCPVSGDVNLGTGLFSHFLLEGFNGIADLNNNGWVSAEEAFRYSRLPTFHYSIWLHFPYTKYLPTFIGIQIPYIYDRVYGQLDLIKY